MKSKKKLTLLSCLSALIAVAGVGTLGASAEGTAKPEALTTFAMQNAASVRTTSPFGIRFTATISGEEFADLQAIDADLECGMLIIPADLVPENEKLDVEVKEDDLLRQSGDPEDPDPKVTNNYERIVADPILNADGSYSVTGGIKGVLTNNFTRPFMARAYVLVDGTYYYTDTFERSIYTAATYAEANLEAGTAAHKYFTEELIDVVEGDEEGEGHYTQSRVEITSETGEFQYNLARVGEKITATGYVYKQIGTKADGTPEYREIESKATLTDANLTHVSGGTYKVKNFGTVDTTADVGAVAAVPGTTLNVEEKYGKITQAVADSNFGHKWGSSNNPFSYVEEFNGKQDVLRFENSTIKSSRYIVGNPALYPQAGKYYVFDAYLTANVNMEWHFYYNGNWHTTYDKFVDANGDSYNNQTGNTYDRAGSFYDDADAAGTEKATILHPTTKLGTEVTLFSWRALDATGAQLTTPISSNYNRWITFEFFFPENADWKFDLTESGVAFYPVATSTAGAHYFANFRINDYALSSTGDLAIQEVGEEKTVYEAGDTLSYVASYTDCLGRPYNNVPANQVAKITATSDVTKPTVSGHMVTFGKYGDVTTTVAFGETTQTYKHYGPLYTYAVDNNNIRAGYTYSSQKINDFATFTALDTFMGRDDVVRMEIATPKAGEAGATGIQFSDAENKAWKQNYYLTIEMYIPNEYTNFFTSMIAESGDVQLNAASGTGFRWYLGTGAAATKHPLNAANDTVKGRWVYLQLKRQRTVELCYNVYSHFSVYPNQRSPFMLYFGNITISNRSLADVETGKLPPVELNSYTLNQLELINDADPMGVYLSNYNYANAVTSKLTKTTEDIENVGLAGTCYEWKETRSNPTFASITFTASIRSNFGKNNYFYFDIYMENAGEQIATKFYNSNCTKLYGGTAAGNASFAFFDPETGEPITEVTNENGETVAANLSNLNGRWVRVRVRNTTSNGFHAYDGLTAVTKLTGKVYLKNLYICKAADLYEKTVDGVVSKY